MTTSSFAELRKNRGIGGIDAIRKQLESSNAAKGKSEDARFWQPTADKVGTGQAMIRFLAAPQDNDYPFVEMYSHGYKNESNGKWYIENCPTTIGAKCPMCESNNELWNLGGQENQDLVRARKRKKSYISNILVVNDPADPSNNGKVFLYKYGPKIFEFISNLANPKFEDIHPVNAFDLWEGANFRLRFCKANGQRSYDQSVFDQPSPVAGSDEKIQAIWEQEYSLLEFKDTKEFKTYEELTNRLNATMGAKHVASAADQISNEMTAYSAPVTPESFNRQIPATPPARPVPPRNVAPATPAGGSDDDDDEAWMNSLLDD